MKLLSKVALKKMAPKTYYRLKHHLSDRDDGGLIDCSSYGNARIGLYLTPDCHFAG